MSNPIHCKKKQGSNNGSAPDSNRQADFKSPHKTRKNYQKRPQKKAEQCLDLTCSGHFPISFFKVQITFNIHKNKTQSKSFELKKAR